MAHGTGAGPGTAARRNLVAFWVCGLINNFGYVVMLSAAQDLLKGSGADVPVAAVLMASIVPTLIVKWTAPFFMHLFSYVRRLWCISLCGVASFYLSAVLATVNGRLFGVAVGSFGCGMGEITFLALSSYYDKNTVSAWSSGTGGAGLIGSAVYAFLRNVLGITAHSSLLLCGGAPLLLLVSYYLILDRTRVERSGVHSVRLVRQDEDQRVGHRTIDDSRADLGDESDLGGDDNRDGDDGHDSDDGAALLDQPQGGPPDVGMEFSDLHEQDAEQGFIASEMTFRDRVAFLKPLLKYMVPLFLVYMSEYTINQGVLPTIPFEKSAPYDNPKQETYIWFQFFYQLGVFCSRSSVNLFPLKRIDMPARLQFLNLCIFIVHALTGFIPHVFIAFALVIWEGLLGGAVYVNAFYLMSQQVPEAQREYALGVATVSDATAITVASIISYFLQPALQAIQAGAGEVPPQAL